MFFISNVSASCSEGQIDINSASLEELENLDGIGPTKAKAIIDARSFDSVDDLTKVVGIKEATLQKIKAQGLACVGNEKSSSKKTTNSNSTKKPIENNPSFDNIQNIQTSSNAKSEESAAIILGQATANGNNSKDINTEESGFFSKDKTAMYGFFAFSVLLGILLMLRRKAKYKNDI